MPFQKIRKATQAINKLQYELASKGGGSLEDTMDRLEDMGIDDIMDGCWIWDIKNNKEVYSSAFCDSLGYSKGEFGTSPEAWQKLILPDSLEKALLEYENHVNSNGEKPYLVKVKYRHKNGHVIQLICEGDMVRWDKHGNPEILFGWHTIIG